jgi:hypothetical protein
MRIGPFVMEFLISNKLCLLRSLSLSLSLSLTHSLSLSLSLSRSENEDEQNRTATTTIKWRRAPETQKARRHNCCPSLTGGHGEEEKQAGKRDGRDAPKKKDLAREI